MLTCIRKAFDECKRHYGLNLTLANVPQDDPEVYDMICLADTLGVFQNAAVGLSLKAYPVSFIRPQLEMLRILTTHVATHDVQNGQLIKVA